MALRKSKQQDIRSPGAVIQSDYPENSALNTFKKEINRLFDNLLNDANDFFSPQKRVLPTLDVIENDKNFKLVAELPGIDPEDVEISITDNFLTISGEKKEEKHESNKNYLRNEVAYGAFERTIALPANADTEEASADFKNGMLTVSVPKKAEDLHISKKLQIKKAA